jgi:hypothetical protein
MDHESDYVAARGAIASAALVALLTACQEGTMTSTDANKAFIAEMLHAKKRLEDYPDRFDPDLVIHEPLSLPFGGTHHGLEEYQRFYPEVRRYYDFGTWQVLGVYGDGDTVFATMRVGVAGEPKVMNIAEEFTFVGKRIVGVRVHVCDATSPTP